MEILFKHAWILCIAITVANGITLKYRSKKYILQNPELEDGYNAYVKGWLLYGNIPWGIVMIGNLSGITQNTLEYLNPSAMNPMVLIFHGSIIILWLLALRWIYFMDGATFIEKHPGLVQKSGVNGSTNVTAKQIKLFFPLLILGGVVGMLMMWSIDFPIP